MIHRRGNRPSPAGPTAIDLSMTSGASLHGGFSISQVAMREDALKGIAKIAVACWCAQEVRELMDDREA